MTVVSRYAPPKALLTDSAEVELSEPLKKVLTGRRLLVISLLVLAVSAFIQFAVQQAAPLFKDTPEVLLIIWVSGLFLFLVAAPVVAIVGAFRLAGAVGHTPLLSFLLACLVVLPALNIAVMGWLVFRGNKVLRANGYRVGVFGIRNT